MGALVSRRVSDIDGIANVFSNGLLNAFGDLLPPSDLLPPALLETMLQLEDYGFCEKGEGGAGGGYGCEAYA